MPKKSRSLEEKGRKAVEKQTVVLQELKVEYVPVDQIHANDYNPNRQSDHEFNLLLKSIREDGFTQPVIVTQDLVIVDGEHRWRAAAKLGMTSIPVCKVNMTEAQRKIATLRHNRARGSEDIGLSAAVLKDLAKLGALDWATDSLDLTPVEVNKLLEDVPVVDALAGDEFTPSWTPGEPKGHFEQANRVESRTIAAVEAQRAAEKNAEAATSEAERSQKIREADTYRISVTFSGEEAKIVKPVLGTNQADAILQLCKDEYQRQQQKAG